MRKGGSDLLIHPLRDPGHAAEVDQGHPEPAGLVRLRRLAVGHEGAIVQHGEAGLLPEEVGDAVTDESRSGGVEG